MNVVSSLLVTCTTLCCGQASPVSGLSTPSPDRSAGVFIGIEKFSYDFSLEDVSFAVNDAVDLAYALVFEHGMMPANRVLILIAGEPLGTARDRLRTLEAAGVRRESARQADIYALVREQSRLVEEGGILVLSIATHGFSAGGDHLLMAEDSLLEFRTGVTADNLLQAAEAGSAGLRLLLLDACREQLVRPSRRGDTARGPDSRSAMRTELVETLAAKRGYAVFSAASIGQWAYSGHANGLFTAAMLRGLRCRQGEEVKTLRGLFSSAGAEVETTSHGRQQPELRIGGGVEDFGLFRCRGEAPSLPPMPPAITPAAFAKIRDAERFLAVGGVENVEQGFRLYRQAFEDLPPESLSSLNQGLLARVRQLGPDAERNEAIRLHRQLFAPLLAQSSGQRP